MPVEAWNYILADNVGAISPFSLKRKGVSPTSLRILPFLWIESGADVDAEGLQVARFQTENREQRPDTVPRKTSWGGAT